MSLTARSWRAALRHSGRQTFSSSAVSQRHTLPTFEKSDNPDLDAVLDLARRRILVPAHLNAAQRRLVYGERHRARLAAEPVRSTVAGADVALEHVDRQRDVPARWAALRDAMALARSHRDWDNVARLLEGLRDAGVGLREGWVEKFVREAGEGRALHVVLRCVQRAERTGVRLRSVGVVEWVMWEVRRVAARSDWGERETERAVGWAEQVVELMEREEHCGGRRVEKGDLRTLPFVIATPLELAAVQALKWKDGVDEDGMVKAYAERLVANLKLYGLEDPTTASAKESAGPEGLLSELSDEEVAEEIKSLKEPSRYEHVNEAGHKIRRLVSVWRGLTLAQRVLGAQMPGGDVETYRTATKLREDIEAAVKTIKENLQDGQSVKDHPTVKLWEDVKNEK
ncbi:Vacuolar aminopeptidase 1 [Neofusicoccum parvum]|nr:Vacuolar aminopeptidase 1 [Neofusicoccum parvum]